MKKILPLIALIGTGIMLTGCSNNLTSVNASSLLDSVTEFKENVDN